MRYNYFLYGPNEQILRKVVDLLAKEKPGSLLDVGAGTGFLSQKLADLGFAVSACDIDPSQFQVAKIPIKKANLGVKLPYRTNSFDYITCTEVIEHLENPWQGCRELARVLKKDGLLILTLPNFSNLVSRWVFFVRGNFRYFDDWTWKHWGHINPITFTELSKILTSVGFEIEAVQTQKEIGQLYAWLFRFFQKTGSTIFHLFKIIRWQKDPKDKILPLLETRPLLFGENLIIKCRKRCPNILK